MSSISIVTPFLNGLHLIPDYAAAVNGANEVVIVDNGSGEETQRALEESGCVYIRNDTNLGFAVANNQGYAKASGDIIIFLNSDVATAGPWLQMVAADVKDGGLYGPSLQQQLVAGRWLPYIEGWCIAATRGTWDRLVEAMWDVVEERGGTFQPIGPWDEFNFRGPYWEDNDLCLRALQADIRLVQTAWPVRHKGGQTAGSIVRHSKSFAANERTFTDRVLAAFPEHAPPSEMRQRYLAHCVTPSDIQHHLPLLYSLARGNVLELGTRSGVSTTALLAGVEAHGGHVWSVDIDPRSAEVAKGHPLWTFAQGDSRYPAQLWSYEDEFSGQLNLILIDTEHTYEMATAELTAWHPYVAPGGTICMHDPETFPGVRRAATEFAAAHGWPITFVLPNNGMAVIERPL